MKYIANPVEVDAFKIEKLGGRLPNGDYQLFLEGGQKEIATKEMCSRMTPQVGDYWVIQSDHYIYLNPKEVFERKYRLA